MVHAQVRISRKPADAKYPYGYGKYETIGEFPQLQCQHSDQSFDGVGTLSVSILLWIGAGGVAHHSFQTLEAIMSGSDVHTLYAAPGCSSYGTNVTSTC